MAFRGPALQYRIRRTTVGNKTGDNYSLTIPKFIAQDFLNCCFNIKVSGNSIVFESGCKLTIFDIQDKDSNKKYIIGGEAIKFS